MDRRAGMSHARRITHQWRLQPLADQDMAHLRRGSRRIGARAMARCKLDKGLQGRRCTRVGQRHGEQSRMTVLGKLADPLQGHCDRRGRAEEQRPGDAKHHHVRVRALVCGIGGPLTDAVSLVLAR